LITWDESFSLLIEVLTMDSAEYDKKLASLTTLKEWLAIPEADVILFTCFGTVAPEILRRTHRLIPPDSDSFRKLLSILGTDAGLASSRNPPTIEARGPDYGLSSQLEDQAAEWLEPANQEWLIGHVKNLKYSPGGLYLLYDALLPRESLRQLKDSRIPKPKVSEVDWFAEVNRLLDTCGWFYVSLPESSQYNLCLFGSSYGESITSKLDARVITAKVEWSEGRAQWPTAPADAKRRW
jgi:hypothetical protein